MQEATLFAEEPDKDGDFIKAFGCGAMEEVVVVFDCGAKGTR